MTGWSSGGTARTVSEAGLKSVWKSGLVKSGLVSEGREGGGREG